MKNSKSESSIERPISALPGLESYIRAMSRHRDFINQIRELDGKLEEQSQSHLLHSADKTNFHISPQSSGNDLLFVNLY